MPKSSIARPHAELVAAASRVLRTRAGSASTRALGELELELLGPATPVSSSSAAIRLGQLRVEQVAHGEVDGHVAARARRRATRGTGAAPSSQHVAAQGMDEARRLDERHELAGLQEAQHRVVPAEERLDADMRRLETPIFGWKCRTSSLVDGAELARRPRGSRCRSCRAPARSDGRDTVFLGTTSPRRPAGTARRRSPSSG